MSKATGRRRTTLARSPRVGAAGGRRAARRPAGVPHLVGVVELVLPRRPRSSCGARPRRSDWDYLVEPVNGSIMPAAKGVYWLIRSRGPDRVVAGRGVPGRRAGPRERGLPVDAGQPVRSATRHPRPLLPLPLPRALHAVLHVVHRGTAAAAARRSRSCVGVASWVRLLRTRRLRLARGVRGGALPGPAVLAQGTVPAAAPRLPQRGLLHRRARPAAAAARAAVARAGLRPLLARRHRRTSSTTSRVVPGQFTPVPRRLVGRVRRHHARHDHGQRPGRRAVAMGQPGTAQRLRGPAGVGGAARLGRRRSPSSPTPTCAAGRGRCARSCSSRATPSAPSCSS